MLVFCLTIIWIAIFFVLEHFLTFVPACLCYFFIAALIVGTSSAIASPLRKKNPKLQKILDNLFGPLFLSAIIGLYGSGILLAAINTIRWLLNLSN